MAGARKQAKPSPKRTPAPKRTSAPKRAAASKRGNAKPIKQSSTKRVSPRKGR